MITQDQTRREFIGGTISLGCGFFTVGALTQLLEGCESPVSTNNFTGGGSGGGPTGTTGFLTINATVSGGTITLTIDDASPLKKVGSAARVHTSNFELLVAHTAETVFKAVSAICTHEGCTITEFDSGVYTCLCHGSQFNTSGFVVRSPASSPLPTKETSFAAPTLTITV